MFIGLTMNNAYFKEKVNVFIALAPVARLDHTMSELLKLTASSVNIIEDVVVDTFHYYDFFPPNWAQDVITEMFCDLLLGICEDFLALFADLDPSVDNMDRINTYLTHVPSGAGYKSFVHYAQFINSKQFQRYDYGSQMNMKLYN